MSFEDRIYGAQPGTVWPVERVEVDWPRNGPMAWAEYLALRAAQRMIFASPAPLERLGIAALARLARAVDRRHTRVARTFLQTALPDLSEEELDRRVLVAWKHLIRVASSSEGFERLIGRPIGEHFDIDLCEDALGLIESSTGAVLIGPHVGNWEIQGGVITALGFNPLYAVGKPPRNSPLARHMQRLRELQGVRLLPRHGAMKGIPQVLQSGGNVALFLDQRTSTKPVYAPFFGRPAPCDRTVGVLLRRSRVPVAFMACTQTDTAGRYRFSMPRVLWPDDLAGMDPAKVAARVNLELERLILDHPEQYFWLHDRYRGAPDRLIT